MTKPAAFHHIGVLTRHIPSAEELYVMNFNYKAGRKPLEIPEPAIRVTFLDHPEAPRIELIQPLEPGSSLGRMAASGTTGYHLAWEVPDLEAAMAALGNSGFHGLPVFKSPLWNGARCGFSIGPDGTLVEFVETTKPEPESLESE